MLTPSQVQETRRLSGAYAPLIVQGKVPIPDLVRASLLAVGDPPPKR